MYVQYICTFFSPSLQLRLQLYENLEIFFVVKCYFLQFIVCCFFIAQYV